MSSQTSAGSTDKPSKAWFLLPIFLGFIGGLIMFFIVKDEDREMAKDGVVFGVILTLVGRGYHVKIPQLAKGASV